MQKSTLPTGVRTLKKWYEKDNLKFSHPVQRSGFQWNLLQRSLLIHSMLAGYPIPPLYLLKRKEGSETTYDALDGKQRMTSIFGFIEGGYALHGGTPEVNLDGVVYDLANLKFEDLSEECRDEILGYRFSIFCLEDATDEEVEEIFRRLNNSTPLSPIQKCRSVLGVELSAWAKEVCRRDFFQHAISLTVAQLRREADLEVLLQTMLLLDARHEGYDYKAISSREVTKYCGHIRGNYNADKRAMMEEIVDYLGESFPEKHKFLKKSNVPMVMVLSKIALEHDVTPPEFKEFLDEFCDAQCPAYTMNMGTGNVKRAKTEGRLVALLDIFACKFDLGVNVDILCIENDTSLADPKGSGEEDGTGAGEETGNAASLVDELVEHLKNAAGEDDNGG